MARSRGAVEFFHPGCTAEQLPFDEHPVLPLGLRYVHELARLNTDACVILESMVSLSSYLGLNVLVASLLDWACLVVFATVTRHHVMGCGVGELASHCARASRKSWTRKTCWED
jgi:hypothetical protein